MYDEATPAGKQFDISLKSTIWPSICTHRHLSQRNEDLCSHKKLYTNIYSSFVHHSQKLETALTSFMNAMVNQAVLHSHQVPLLLSSKKVWALDVHNLDESPENDDE